MKTLLTTAWLLLMAPLAVAQNNSADSRPAEQPRAEREGGIPKELIAPDQDAAGQEGTEDGAPRFRDSADGSTNAASRSATAERHAPNDARIAPYWLPPEQNHWKLGVYAHYSDHGVLITRVVPGSAAQRVGLERGDRIVTVNGFQVGWINDRLFPLDAEFQRRADRFGRVLLLVQNVRTSQLVNLDVTLDGRQPFRNNAERPRRFDSDRLDRGNPIEGRSETRSRNNGPGDTSSEADDTAIRPDGPE